MLNQIRTTCFEDSLTLSAVQTCKDVHYVPVTLRYAARAKRIRTKPVVVMDPREALIVSLKREVTALREENSQLRQLLQVGGEGGGPLYPRSVTSNGGGRLESLSKEKVEEMEQSQLVETVHQFLEENAALRQENWEMIAVRDLLIRDQELVCRENERLLRKLEDVNSVCCRSPIAAARPSYSADLITKSQSDDEIASGLRRGVEDETTWNGFEQQNGRTSKEGVEKVKPPTSQQMPDANSREIAKRRIGKNNLDSSHKTHRKNNSWGKVGSRDSSGGSLKSGGSSDSLPAVQGKRVILNANNRSSTRKRSSQRSAAPKAEDRNLVI